MLEAFGQGTETVLSYFVLIQNIEVLMITINKVDRNSCVLIPQRCSIDKVGRKIPTEVTKEENGFDPLCFRSVHYPVQSPHP
jgi:hypothetical protein